MRYDVDKFTFAKRLEDVILPTDVFVLDIQQKIITQQELYDLYKSIITLPNYFGNNWNAFWDVLADLSWVPQKNIVIKHFLLPDLSEEELKTYLEILIDSINHWNKFPEHKVFVYFLDKDKDKIKNIIKNS